MIITNIQRMCFHDGPGIRSTVFFKGCSIHCPWCSNPENINPRIEFYNNKGEKGVFGKFYTPQSLYGELIKDISYWKTSNGGVTFSGGEAMLQYKELFEVASFLMKDKVSSIIETSLFISPKTLNQIYSVIDGFIVDVKILDSQKCQNILGGNIDLFLKNISFLHNQKKILLFRVPLCKNFTYTPSNINLFLDFFSKYKDVPVQIFSVHNLGEIKYRALNKTVLKYPLLTTNELEIFLTKLKNIGIKAEIISI